MQLDFSDLKLVRDALNGKDVREDPRTAPLLARIEEDIASPQRFLKDHELPKVEGQHALSADSVTAGVPKTEGI